MFGTPEHLLRRNPSSLYHQKKGNLSSFYEQPRHFFSKNKSRWWFPNVYLRKVIQFDLNISQTGLSSTTTWNKKNPSPSPCLRTPPTSPPVFPQFDNMILTPDGHLKLLDFGTGDQEWRKTPWGKVEELPPPWSWENGKNMGFRGSFCLKAGWWFEKTCVMFTPKIGEDFLKGLVKPPTSRCWTIFVELLFFVFQIELWNICFFLLSTAETC